MDSSAKRTNTIVVIVLIHIQPGQENQYQIYERQAEQILTEYGGKVQQVMTPYAAAGAIATPDEVRVMTFPDQAALAAYQSDPRMMSLRSRRDSTLASTVMILGRPNESSG